MLSVMLYTGNMELMFVIIWPTLGYLLHIYPYIYIYIHTRIGEDNMDAGPSLPNWVTTLSGYSSIVSSLIIFSSIILHLRNYRKPFQQRLMIRIQLIVPLFALSCFSMLQNPTSLFNRYFLESIREVYEAFVIYTFFSLLTDILGGERNIIIMTSGREPVEHPGVLRYIFPDIDISDPTTFLIIKRGILQYVWLKPIICTTTILTELLGWYDVNDVSATSIYFWLTILYNLSVTMSLYCLAMFWKVLWNDLKPFKPVGKFLCVKLIIFASYWQGVMLAICNYTGILPGSETTNTNNTNIGVYIQNALLCIELIAFAIGHWYSFSYKPFTISKIPNGRLKFYYAVKDMFGIRDLVHDFRLTFYGDYYKDYKRFNSVEGFKAHPESKVRMSRINQGLRYHSDGKQKHWLPNSQQTQNQSSVRSTSEANALLYLPLIGNNPQYSPSLNSTGTSTRGIYPSSPKNTSPPDSPLIPPSSGTVDLMCGPSITEVLNTSEISYDKELLDEDELYYQNACSAINNYRLDQTEVKRLINYPIVDEVVDGHMFGYKVRKLRADRLRHQQSNRDISLNGNKNQNYGSIV